MKIVSATLYPLRLSLRRPVVNAKHTVLHRDGVLLRLVSDEGHVGWGEASPYPGFGLESVDDARRFLEIASKELLGCALESVATSVSSADQACPSAAGALECALLDLVAHARGATLRDLIGEGSTSPIESIACNALVTADDIDELAREARAARSSGFRTFKLKVGARELDEDVDRVERLRGALGPEALIRLDANGAYELETAWRAVERFAVHDIEYLEQPLDPKALTEMSDLRSRSPVRIAADESATTQASVARVIESRAADLIVIKPSAAGGPLAAMRIARAARAAGLGVVVTSMLDGAVAVSAALQVAAALAGEGDLPACGLATSGLFKRDLAQLPRVVDGRVRLSPRPGLGIEVEPAQLNTFARSRAIDASA